MSACHHANHMQLIGNPSATHSIMPSWTVKSNIMNLAIWMFLHKSHELLRRLKIMGDALRDHHLQSTLQWGRYFFCGSRVFKVVNVRMIWKLDQFCQVRISFD